MTLGTLSVIGSDGEGEVEPVWGGIVGITCSCLYFIEVDIAY